MFGTKYELFLPSYQITFFLSFGQAIIFSSFHILMSILIHIFFVTKKSLNNGPYRKLSMNCKQYFKIRKKLVLIKCLFNKVPPYLLYCMDMGKPYYIRGVRRVKKRSVHRCFTESLVLKVLQNL